MNTKLVELRDAYEKAVDAYVEAFNNKEKGSKQKKLKKDAADLIKAYNTEMEQEIYRNWNDEGDPIKIAIRTLKVNKGVSVTYKVNDDTDTMSSKFKDADIYISLPMMQYVLGKKVFNEPDWFNKVEKLAQMYANYLAEIMGTVKFDYPINEISKAFNFDEDVNVYSADGIMKALQVVFNSILYVDNVYQPGTNLITPMTKVVHNDAVVPVWEYIRNSMTVYTKADGLKIHNTGAFSYIIADAMHKILTSDDFKLSCEEQFIMQESPVDKANAEEKVADEPKAEDKPKKAKKSAKKDTK